MNVLGTDLRVTESPFLRCFKTRDALITGTASLTLFAAITHTHGRFFP
jgi:hypothetical protein